MEIKIPENTNSSLITPVSQIKPRPKKGGVRGLRELRELKKQQKTLETSKLSKLSNNPSPRSKEESLFSLKTISNHISDILRPNYLPADKFFCCLESFVEETYLKINSFFDQMSLERFLFVFSASVGEYFCESALQGKFLGAEIVQQIHHDFMINSKTEDIQNMGISFY